MSSDEDLILLYKLITGELVIGTLDRKLTEETKGDIVYLKNPAIIGLTQDSFYLTKYNLFSKSNFIMITGKNIVYVDMPDDRIIAHYRNLFNPKVSRSFLDDEGMEHTVH
jgi:hypothetical protein